MATALTGGCHCEQLRYRITGSARFAGHCHCRSCQRSAGAAYVSWGTWKADQVQFDGTLSTWASSTGVTRGFCASCGTTLSYAHQKRPAEVDITLASLDDPSAVEPSCHIWIDDRISWTDTGNRLPVHAGWASSSG